MTPNTCYLVCCTARSGSTLLCEGLWNTGVAGQPAEYFWQDDEQRWATTWGLIDYDYADFVRAAMEQTATPNGVFGAKMAWGYAGDFVQKLQPDSRDPLAELPSLLPKTFPNLRYIWLRRRDTVRQAISHWKAMQTGAWNWMTEDKPTLVQEPHYDGEAIAYLARQIDDHNLAWRSYFTENGIEPFEVVYEELVNRYEETLGDILDFLEIAPPADLGTSKRRLKRQADAQSDEWVRRYQEDDGAGASR
ncbi:MAG: sulfotransferase [Chloroflexi bacterium]|nr:sulfotransferase [Chloroflexota bacterium]